jgi:dolichol-phosphate mannosyltransferase
MKTLAIVIPCYNEEKGIGKVIDSIPYKKINELGFNVLVYVIDNNSSDNTSAVAASHNAIVLFEGQQGKGAALRKGFSELSVDTDIVIMLDGDNTYKATEIPRMIEPITSGFCDVVIGSRLEGKTVGEALSFSHRLANWFFTFSARTMYQTNVTDTCTGFFAWKKEVIEQLFPHIQSKGFAIEAEMITKMAKLGYKIYSVPITYERREGESKLSPILDGIKITLMLYRNILWKPKKVKSQYFQVLDQSENLEWED